MNPSVKKVSSEGFFLGEAKVDFFGGG